MGTVPSWQVCPISGTLVDVVVVWDEAHRIVRIVLGGDEAVAGAYARRHGARLLAGRGVPAHVERLRAYLAGVRVSLDLPVRLFGTSFQRSAWGVLGRIPYGSTWTYGDQARAIGRPRAVRAVGAANGKNPVPLVLPCHRVVAAGRRLGGFTGGVALKARLLAHEGVAWVP